MSARYDWETIRAEYEAGATMGDLSRKHGADKASIGRRAKKEGWTPDLAKAVNRGTEAKVNGTDAALVSRIKAETPNRAADAKAAVMLRHKDEWERQREISDRAMAEGDCELAKLAKLTAEILKIRQEGERKAWGITDKAETEVSGGVVVTWQH